MADWLKRAAGLIAAMFLAAWSSLALAQERPHILLFIADDLSWHDLGAYGNKDVRTPNLDRLAAEGMTFDRAFAASPTCTPSRSSLYTGLYPVRNGAHANHSLIDAKSKTLPEYLKAQGYRVVIAGKTHIGPREEVPFEYLPNSNVSPPGKPHVLHTDLGLEAIDRLLKSHDKKQPLALIVAAHSPHVYWPANDGYDAARLTLPPYLIDTPETRVAMTRYYTDVTKLDGEVGQVRGSLKRHGYAGNTLFFFTSDQGAQFPFAKWTLYDAGVRAPLIASWSGRVAAAARSSAIVSLVDMLPTMVEVAGGQVSTGIDGESFAPVLFGRASSHLEQAFAAHTGDGDFNQAPMRMIRTARFKYIENLRPDLRYGNHISDAEGADGRDYWDSWVKLAEADPAAARAVSRFRDQPPEELYDLSNDPFELVNLADDPHYAKTLVDLRGRLNAWRVSQGERLDRVLMSDDAKRGKIPYRE